MPRPLTALRLLSLSSLAGVAAGCFFDPSQGAGVEQGVSDPRGTPTERVGAGGSGPGAPGAGGTDRPPHGQGGEGDGVGGTATAPGGPDGVRIVALSAVMQRGTPGALVGDAPAFRVEDAEGVPLSGVSVEVRLDDDEGVFRVASGPPTRNAMATTDAAGVVHLDAWQLPRETGFNTLEVDVASEGSGLTFVAEAASDFEVRIEPLTPLEPHLQAAFERAERRWEAVILNGLPALASTLPNLARGCGIESGAPTGDVTTRGIVIFADITPIDGAGGILGSAGPCLIRSQDRSPVSGLMRFDSADVANLVDAGAFEAVILHEMGHVLGVGTLWGYEGFLRNPSVPDAPGADTHHVGPRTRAAFDAIGGQFFQGGASVPVENSARPGSGDGHWRESVATNELMTPFLDSGVAPLSRLTVASVDDFPYYVANYLAADAFVLAPSLAASPGPATSATKPTACHVLRPAPRGPLPAGTLPALPPR
ncbi:MAG: leishmanolysin-related zinc metalloendopeptidase [Myxococcota bacterium]